MVYLEVTKCSTCRAHCVVYQLLSSIDYLVHAELTRSPRELTKDTNRALGSVFDIESCQKF